MVPDCGRLELARNFCSTHYGRWRKWKDPLYVPPRPTVCPRGHPHDQVNSRGARVCSICRRENQRRSGKSPCIQCGNATWTKPVLLCGNCRPPRQRPLCQQGDCIFPIHCRGLCKGHYSRWRRGSRTPGTPIRIRRSVPDRNSFGALIWKARVDAELTLDDLAQMVGRNRGTIRQWERDICVPTHYAESVVSSLATALGVDKDLLLSVRVARWCKQREPSSRVCSLDGCLNPHCARGFCNMHWNRWRNTGDPGPVNRLIRLPQPLCEVFDCGGKHYGLGLCSKCYQRFKNRRDGPPMSRKCLIGCQCGRHHKTFRAQWVLDLKQVSL